MSSTGDEYDEGDQDVNQNLNFQSLPETTELEEDRKDGLASGDEHFIESDDERYGRFHGPDPSWRFYTQGERTLAAVLDQAENNDLSIHLYNAHQWKSQHRRQQYHDHVNSWRNKQSWSDRDEQGKLPFLPNSIWTAWPLMPSDVPRSDERWGVPIRNTTTEIGTLSRVVPWRPSLDLEEVVKGEILRQAKRRYEEREWFSGKSSSSSSSSQDSAQVSSSDAGSSAEEDDVEQNTTAPASNAQPSFLIDEDTAGALTGLTTRHIIAKLNDVLNGLHHSRTGHRTTRSRSRSRSRRLASSSHSRCTSPAEAESKRREIETTMTRESDDLVQEPAPFQDIDVDVDDEADRASASKRKTHRHQLGPRDWSEVLGIASLTGWDQNIIDRAARRCTALFGEGMDFRVMPGDEIVRYVPGMSPVEVRSLESDDQCEMPTVGGGPGQFPCPHESCPRHEEPYEKRWRLREHMKRKHHHSDEELGEVLRGSVQIPQPRAISASSKYESVQNTEPTNSSER